MRREFSDREEARIEKEVRRRVAKILSAAGLGSRLTWQDSGSELGSTWRLPLKFRQNHVILVEKALRVGPGAQLSGREGSGGGKVGSRGSSAEIVKSEGASRLLSAVDRELEWIADRIEELEFGKGWAGKCRECGRWEGIRRCGCSASGQSKDATQASKRARKD